MLTEPKIVIQRRLEMQGLWEEANALRKQAIKDICKRDGTRPAHGVGTPEQQDEAWEIIAAKYSPESLAPATPPPGEPVVAAAAPPPPPPPEPEPELPPAPQDLPDSTDVSEDILWVYNNYMTCVVERPGRSTVIYWDRVQVPNKGCRSMLEAITLNKHKFLFDLVPQAMQAKLKAEKGEEQDPELVRAERRSIAEIERVMEAFQET